MRVESCVPTEKKCGSAGRVPTAVTRIAGDDGVGEGDGELVACDGTTDGDGVGDSDSGAGEIVGRAARQALDVTATAATMARSAERRRIAGM
jgi:hypothetical protein